MSYLLQLIYSYNKMIFMQFELETAFLETDDSLKINIERALEIDQNMIEKILEINYPRGITPTEINDRLNQGNQLYIATKNKDIVCYGWIAFGSHDIPYLNCKIKLFPDEFYEYGVSVKENYRGQGVLNQYRKYVYGRLRKKSYKTAITSYMRWNKSVEKANKKFQYQFLGEVVYGYFLLFRYFFNRMPKGKIQNFNNFLGKWKKLITIIH